MPTVTRHPARFYEKTAWDNVSCRLCPHLCSIAPSRTGVCGVRGNRGGELYVDNFNKLTAELEVVSDDLPLFHFKPGRRWLQLAGRGCTMRCPFCNTYRFSQTGGVRPYPATAEGIVARAVEEQMCGVSFGVNEPAPMHEFVEQVFALAREAGLATHLATGGMWSNDPFREILELTDAITLGLKGFDEFFFQRQLGADRGSILLNLKTAIAMGRHIELSWLVIPGHTDSEKQAKELLEFCATFGHYPPLVLLPFQPDFTWMEKSKPAGPAELEAFHRRLAAYGGPVYEKHPASRAQDTRCGRCQRPLVRRGEAGIIVTQVSNDAAGRSLCPGCGTPVPYVA